MALPFTDPVLIFASVMVLILLAPLLAGRVRLPGIVGLIAAGIIVGPHGAGLLERDQTIQLLGKVGLLYIMFLAGLEIDLNQVRQNKGHALLFGLLTFFIPFFSGIILGMTAFAMSLPVAILLASMISSHTLLTFPIVAKLGITRSATVTTTIGGTIITDILALLVLAVIAGTTHGTPDTVFWIRLVVLMVLYTAGTLFLIPKISRWFLNTVDSDENSEFVFVLSVTFISAYLAHLAGLEPIIGAFFAGLALNSLIPERSLLMTRIHFTGDAIFIPFFLISIGMLVDPSLLFTGTRAWVISLGMIGVALGSKFVAALLTGNIFGYLKDDGMLMFGLSVNQAAATLASVLVGYNLGLFDETVITGTIMMIAVTCFVGSVVTQRAGRKVALREERAVLAPQIGSHRIMVPIKSREQARILLDIAFLLHERGSNEPLFPLQVVEDSGDTHKQVAAAEKVLDQSIVRILSANIPVMPLTKVDLTIASGILHAISDYRISMLLLNWNGRSRYTTRAFGRTIDTIIERSTPMVMLNRVVAPVNTCSRIVLLLPPFGHLQAGFNELAVTVKTLASQAGTSLLVLCCEETRKEVKSFFESARPIVSVTFTCYVDLKQILGTLQTTLQQSDWLLFMGARKGEIAWQPTLDRLPGSISREFPALPFSVLIGSTLRRSAPQGVSHLSLTTSIFKPQHVRLGLESDTAAEVIGELLTTCFERGLSRHAYIAEQLGAIGKREPVELVNGVVLLHTYISDVNDTMVLLGVSTMPLRDIPLSSGAPYVIIILLDPIGQDPERHLQALADIANLLKIKGVVGTLKKVRTYEELVLMVGNAAQKSENHRNGK
ncbi:MAG: PTS transporter subunit EIIA [Fibrobacter sp.]|nr:PTS transporter subunit EIIA [Fibrobacter sp.]